MLCKWLKAKIAEDDGAPGLTGGSTQRDGLRAMADSGLLGNHQAKLASADALCGEQFDQGRQEFRRTNR